MATLHFTFSNVSGTHTASISRTEEWGVGSMFLRNIIRLLVDSKALHRKLTIAVRSTSNIFIKSFIHSFRKTIGGGRSGKRSRWCYITFKCIQDHYGSKLLGAHRSRKAASIQKSDTYWDLQIFMFQSHISTGKRQRVHLQCRYYCPIIQSRYRPRKHLKHWLQNAISSSGRIQMLRIRLHSA